MQTYIIRWYFNFYFKSSFFFSSCCRLRDCETEKWKLDYLAIQGIYSIWSIPCLHQRNNFPISRVGISTWFLALPEEQTFEIWNHLVVPFEVICKSRKLCTISHFSSNFHPADKSATANIHMAYKECQKYSPPPFQNMLYHPYTFHRPMGQYAG